MLKEPMATFEANKIWDGIADVLFIKGMQLVKYYLAEYKRGGLGYAPGLT
jgi:hypothetical protein